MKNILLVYPKIPTTYWSFDHALPFVRKRATNPPLGLMTVAAMLPEEYQLTLVDMNVENLAPDQVERADLVFISAMIVQQKSFKEVVAMCNQAGTPVVAGGPYPISSYEEIEEVAHFVLDEAEVTLPRFLADYEAGAAEYLYRSTGKPSIHETPVPRFDLIDVGAYDLMSLQYSRGCPYNCEFCDIIEMFGRVQRTKTPEQFLKEIQAVYDTGFRGTVFIVDDNFVGNKRESKNLLREIVTWQETHGYPFTFFTEASVDLARDEELMTLMQQSGFTMVFLGIETPDEESLVFTQKRQNLGGGLHESVRKIQHHGMEVSGGFILGFDTDTSTIFDRQITFIQEAGIPMAMVGLLCALPNTQLHRRLIREGRMRNASSGNNTYTLSLNFEPKMPESEITAGYKRVIATLYTPKNYFARCRTFIHELPESVNVNREVSWTTFRAFLISLMKQGFSSYGLTYLRFLLGIAVTRPKYFPDAVTFAIKGYHHFIITGEILAAEKLSDQLEDSIRDFTETVGKLNETQKITRAGRAVSRRIRKREKAFARTFEKFSDGTQESLHDRYTEYLHHSARWVETLSQSAEGQREQSVTLDR
jgi:radical SAM superfamily enzyme YgiQ (UPF0313 family)